MIASSTNELALKRPGCVNLHAELRKDPFWDRPYLMCTSTINHQSYVDDSKLHLTFPVKAIDTPTRQITEDLKKDFSRGAVKIAL